MEEKKTNSNNKTEASSSIFHDFKNKSNTTMLNTKSIVIFAVIIALGVGAGYFFSQGNLGISSSLSSKTENTSTGAKAGTIVGSDDTKTFSDTVTGVMTKGGIDGEGQFHLVRPGGDSQNVYLTSSIVDLSQFVGKKVKVNGQTQKAKKAGWLMDVGRVEVLE